MLTGRPSLRRDGAGISRRQEPRAVAQEQGSHGTPLVTHQILRREA